MHYSRIMPAVDGHRYFTSTAVFLNEVIKLAVSLTIALYDISRTLPPSTPATVLFEQLYMSVFSGDGWKLAIPATLYTLQNSLQYVAVSNLEAVSFQILYQLKVRGIFSEFARICWGKGLELFWDEFICLLFCRSSRLRCSALRCSAGLFPRSAGSPWFS